MTYRALVMLLAGVGIPVPAARDAAMGLRLGSPMAAAAALFCVALAASLSVWRATGATAARQARAPRHLYLAGLPVAFCVPSGTVAAPRLGLGNAVFFVLLGQLLSAAGIAVMVLGKWITQRA